MERKNSFASMAKNVAAGLAALSVVGCGTGPYGPANGVRKASDVSDVVRVSGNGGPKRLNTPCDDAFLPVRRWLEENCGYNSQSATDKAQGIVGECQSGQFVEPGCDQTAYQCVAGGPILKVRSDGDVWETRNGYCEKNMFAGTEKTGN